jgi:tetratricopeptide (TPR) repeat protein
MHEFRDGYDFSHDLLRETAYMQVSPPKRWLLHRRIAQALELLHADNMDMVSAQLAEQYARGGRPGRAVAYYRRAADVAASRFAHAEAIRLHKEALSIVRRLPEGKDRDSQELAVLEAMAAPLTARFGYSSPELQQTLERSIDLADSLGHLGSKLTSLVALSATRFVQGRTADAYQVASRALTLVGPESEPSGPAHFMAGGPTISLGRPAEGLRHLELATHLASGALLLSIGTRPDADALSSCNDAIKLARTIGHPYSLAVALAYGAITHQVRQDISELKDRVGELRELCERYGFAYYRDWGLVLDGWSRMDEPGISLARRGISNLRSAGSFARMPYWLSLLADMLTRNNRPAAARATLDAALAAGQARDDLWWLPEVMRMRATHDDGEAAGSRLRSAAQLAAAHGSVALLRRCERDLAERGVRSSAPGVLPTA